MNKLLHGNKSEKRHCYKFIAYNLAFVNNGNIKIMPFELSQHVLKYTGFDVAPYEAIVFNINHKVHFIKQPNANGIYGYIYRCVDDEEHVFGINNPLLHKNK